ncbi:MAG: IS110 family transposase [Hyphomicrobiaceae bacterium]|nr:IS110 family transposase [Hyphomicrobiaceae bacterium]
MVRKRNVSSHDEIVFGAIELSKAKWLLAVQMSDLEQPSIYQLTGGDVDALIERLEAVEAQHRKRTGRTLRIVVCYEAGYDGFWLWRVLQARGITCHVIDAASIEINRRRRRPKTDRIDAAKLVRVLRTWYRGEREVCSMVRVPTCEEEDLRRSHRERCRLVSEQTAHVNRIKGLLFAYGIRNLGCRCDRLVLDGLMTGDGRPLPERLKAEITREMVRLKQVQAQIAEVEKERDTVEASSAESEPKRHRLLELRGIGPALASILTREVYYRAFENRRQVASYIGVTPSPYSSGQTERNSGISKAGNRLARYIMIEAAWLWLRHQPQSALSRWYALRTEGHTGRVRRIMLVGLARKLAVALWRYVETGLVPHGAITKAVTAK